MMPIQQHVALELAAQQLARWGRHDYSSIRMIDHYLGRVPSPDPRVIAIVEQASLVIRPLIDATSDTEAEVALLNHRLRSCRAEYRNLAEHLAALPGRLPETPTEWHRAQLAEWLAREVATAPIARGLL